VIIDKRPVIELLSCLKDSELRVCHKLSPDHVYVQGPRQQNVKLAAPLLSETVSKGILYCESQKTIQSTSASDTDKFLELVNMWFDIYSSRVCFDKFKKSQNTYGTNSMEQDGILNEM
jgi:hypothetical protein